MVGCPLVMTNSLLVMLPSLGHALLPDQAERESVLRDAPAVAQVLLRDAVLRLFPRRYLRNVRIVGVFHAVYGIGFERVPFLD
jgi:hypothetical protein